MAEKESFVLYTKYGKQIRRLSMEERGVLLTAIFDYMEGGTPPPMSDAVEMAFGFIQDQLEADLKKWEETCKRRVDSGRKGGIAKAKNAKQSVAKKASASFATQNLANVADSEGEYEGDSEYEGEGERIPPTVDRGKTGLGLYENVFLTPAQRKKLEEAFPADADRLINRLSEYMNLSGKRYGNHLAVLLKWGKEDAHERGDDAGSAAAADPAWGKGTI